MTEGIYLGIFGFVLAAGGIVLSRKERRGRDEGRFLPSQRWRLFFPYAAVVLIVTAAVISVAPSPQRTLDFAASDFKLRTVSYGGGPYENYFRSRSFSVFVGEALFPGLSISWTDNRTGSVVQHNLATAWVTEPTDSPAPIAYATGNVAPADGSYVLWVRYGLCETPATPPCSNYTASVTGNLVIATQKAYVPVQLALGAAGSALIAVALIQSGIGSRRTTSR
jgi:hypothetical protein